MKEEARQIAGRQAEDRVFEEVSKLPGVKVYRNLYVPAGGGRTTEIDIVVLHSKGLWTLEVKSYSSGYICGSESRYEWSHHYKPPGPKSKKTTTKFYNPIRQNHRAIEVLSRYLGVPAKGLQPGLVVFSDSATLRKVPARTDACTVLQTRFVFNYLKRSFAKRKPRFSPTELRRLQQQLDSIPKANKGIKNRHIAQVKQAESMRKAEQERRRASRKKTSLLRRKSSRD